MRRPGLAEFPDAVTKRGAKHLDELAAMVAAGARAVMLFLVQIGSAERFALARDIDPAYGRAFDRAQAAGVEAIACRCRISRRRHRGRGGDPHRRWSRDRPLMCLRRPRACLHCDAAAASGPPGGGAAAMSDMSYVDAALAPQRKTGQIKLHGPAGLRGHAQGRPAGRRMPRHARRRGPARASPTEQIDRLVFEFAHGPQRAAGDADVPRLPQVDLHLDQPRGLPRHPERQAAARRRHRQHRRDADPRRLARRFEPHVSRSARSRAAPSG